MQREQISALNQYAYGHAEFPQTRDLATVWKATKTIAAARRPLSEPSRLYLIARMSAVGAPYEVIEEVLAWNEQAERPETLAARVAAPGGLHWRAGALILYEALSMAMAGGDVEPNELETIGATASALDLRPETLEALLELCREEAALRRRRIAVLSMKCATSPRFDWL